MCHSGRSKKTLIKDKIGTCHFTDFGLCKASLIEHLSVTELPAWAWISGLPSMVTTGTGKKKRQFNWTNLWEVRQTLIRIFTIGMYVTYFLGFQLKNQKQHLGIYFYHVDLYISLPFDSTKARYKCLHQNWDTLVFFTRFFV